MIPKAPTLRNPIYHLPVSGGMNPGRQVVSNASGATLPLILVAEEEAMSALELEQVLTEASHEIVLALDSPGALACAAVFAPVAQGCRSSWAPDMDPWHRKRTCAAWGPIAHLTHPAIAQ
jgi:hypothetical protein